MKKLFVAWRDPDTREWSPVAQLIRTKDLYTFEYTQGALISDNFKPFGQMIDLNKKYVSSKLFPIFSNRILAKGRPEYIDYLNWLGMDAAEYDAMDELSLTGGLRATDDLEIFPCPQPTATGRYNVTFFCRGLKHLHRENIERSQSLAHGEKLFLMQDRQNKKDRGALLLRSDDPITLVGYTPRYFSPDFNAVIEQGGVDSVSIVVDQVNNDAPLQYRIRCNLECAWPSKFEACSGEKFQTLCKEHNGAGLSLP